MIEDYRAGLGSIEPMTTPTGQPVGRWPARPSSCGRPATISGELYRDPLDIWRAWATDVRGREIESGHHMAEEIPDLLAAHLRDFLRP